MIFVYNVVIRYGGAYKCIVQVRISPLQDTNRPPPHAALPQVVQARTSDPDQNYFVDEYDGEGLGIDEASHCRIRQLFL